MPQQFTGIEYLCIDIANTFGEDKAIGFKGDKDTFDNRIQWVKDNFNKLEERIDEVNEDKYLYIKAVQALRKVCKGEPTGHLIALDATCSGLQILSALTGCKSGARITNLLPSKTRYDAYTEITSAMQTLLTKKGLKAESTSRKDAKQAVMTSLYASEAIPKEVFKVDSIIDTFYETCYLEAPGAFTMLPIMKKAWQSMACEHKWIMPDNFHVVIPVVETKETRIEINELNHKFKTSYKVIEGKKSGISLPANITHS